VKLAAKAFTRDSPEKEREQFTLTHFSHLRFLSPFVSSIIIKHTARHSFAAKEVIWKYKTEKLENLSL
jgi:hypothetical protein